MAKKFQTEGNLLHHHHHQHPHEPNTHAHTDSSRPSVSSGASATQQNRTSTDSGNRQRESIEYIPPELSLTDRRDSDDVCCLFVFSIFT